jgi:hypothetical protein
MNFYLFINVAVQLDYFTNNSLLATRTANAYPFGCFTSAVGMISDPSVRNGPQENGLLPCFGGLNPLKTAAVMQKS